MTDFFFSEPEMREIRNAFRRAESTGRYFEAYSTVAAIVQERRVSLPDSREKFDLLQTEIWLKGASQANQGSGPFSDLIRSYTIRQGQLRYGRTFENSEIQIASDNVARAVFSDIIANRKFQRLRILHLMMRLKLVVHCFPMKVVST